MIMNLLDSTVISVAAPAIRADLAGTYAELQWSAAAYTLAMAVGLLTGGRLGDMFGRRRMALIGVAGFAAASLACALAWSPQVLIAARIVQGLFAAVMIPQSFGLIRDLFPPQQAGQAFAALGPVIGLSTILGPVVAGLLIDADLFGTGWRMIFGINLPLAAFALIAGGRALPTRPATARRSRLDLPGVVLGGAAMFMLVFPLMQGRELGWPTWSVAMLAGATPVLAIFAWYQIRRTHAGHTPLVDLAVFAKRSYTSGVVFVIVFFGAIAGITLAIGLFLQLGLGFTPLGASLAMSSWAIGSFAGSLVGSTLTPRLGRRILHVGLVVMAAGLAGVLVALSLAGIGLGGWDLAVPLLAFGAGMGMIFALLFEIILGDIDDHQVGSASGILESLQQLGASLGVAIIATTFFGVIGAAALHNFDTAAAPRLRAELTTAGVPATTREQIVTSLRTCVHDTENATTPDAVPASCRTADRPATPAITKAIAAAAVDTHKRDSLAAARTATQLALALTALAFAIGFFLPARPRRHSVPTTTTGASHGK
ncbi:MFS transporter [Nonomuraea sp. LPB2021202275-12-8]|uniref:MFS transporter n=1 Tax=Nonomuraea sp. LPB2021202275-12-8 TaxID=3120159 RepID=UPI00300CB0C6